MDEMNNIPNNISDNKESTGESTGESTEESQDDFYDFDGTPGIEIDDFGYTDDDSLGDNSSDDDSSDVDLSSDDYLEGVSELGTIVMTICIREDVFDQTTLRNIAGVNHYFRRLAEANLHRIAIQLAGVYPHMVSYLRRRLMNPIPFVESRIVKNRFDAHWWNPGFGIEVLRRTDSVLTDLPGWRSAAVGRIVIWTTIPRGLLTVFSLNGLPLCSHEVTSYERIDCDPPRYFSSIEIFADNPLVLDDHLWPRSQLHISISAGWTTISTVAGPRVIFQPDIDLCAEIITHIVVEYRRYNADMRYWRYCDFTPNWTVYRKSLIEPRPGPFLL